MKLDTMAISTLLELHQEKIESNWQYYTCVY